MQSQDMDKHMIFLREYSCKNNILFRVSRKGISIEDVSREALESKKNSKGLQSTADESKK